MINKDTEAIINSLTGLLLPTNPLPNKMNTFDAEEVLVKNDWESLLDNCLSTRVLLSPCEKFVVRIGSAKRDNYTYHACNAIEHDENPYFQNVYWHIFDLQKSLEITLTEYLVELDDSYFAEIELIVEAIPEHCYEMEMSQSLLEDMDHFSGLADAVFSIDAVMQDFDLCSDLALRNFMQRPDGQLVVIDPYQ